MHLVHWHDDAPSLERPVLILALDGFIDAGSVASTASTFLRHRWLADAVAVFDGDALIDYRARRPSVVIDAGRLRRVDWPKLELLGARTGGPHDALLLIGPEPDMQWHAFCDAVADVCRRYEVPFVVSLGAYPAATPHTRPVSIVRADNAAVQGVELPPILAGRPVTGYTGPIGASTALEAALAESNVPAIGLWAEVPHYISGSPYPPGALAMVRMVAQLLETTVDTTELEAASTHHLRQVDEAVAEHEEAAQMISGLEELRDAGAGDEMIPDAEDLAAEIERFLRTQPGE
jgi:proteasome assembly chaperone (PAC2) family protein